MSKSRVERVRKFLGLRGIVEVDECFIGGKERNKHEHKKLKAGRGSVGKTAVVGLRERGGRTVAMPIEATDMAALQSAVHANANAGFLTLRANAVRTEVRANVSQ